MNTVPGREHAIQVLHTPGGERFGLLGEKGTHPAPTLFLFTEELVFASRLEDSPGEEHASKVGGILGKQGYLGVSLGLPCHGEDVRASEPEGMRGWRVRLENGEDVVARFTTKVSSVLDTLIQEEYSDPGKVAICGTSRGGFMAMHAAAADPRVKCAVALAPVTDLLVLSEFAGMENPPAADALSLAHTAERLAERALWICIGNNDERVGTESAIAFTRSVVKASVAQGQPANVEIHVMPSPGHRLHATAHAEAAAWILAQMSSDGSH